MKPNRSTMRSRLKNRRGAMLVFVAISMIAFIGMLAMTMDIGASNRQRRIAQTAADAGAIGGATQIYRNLDSATVDSVARKLAGLNGFNTGVTVNYPPKAGAFIGNNRYVEVIIDKNIPTLFGGIFNKTSMDIKARAVAGTGAFSNFCMVALGNSGNAIDIPGTVDASNCGVASNSGIDVRSIVAPYIAAGGTVAGGCGGTVHCNVPPFPDPFDALTLPINADTICTVTNLPTITKDTVLNPGVYCGTGASPRGISVNNNITITMRPGTYFIRGGGLSGGEIKATGGVTIINAIGANSNTAVYRPITFGNSCLFSVTAPTTGAYKGIAVFTDRRAPTATNTVCGNGDIMGIIYMPTQTFELQNSNGKLTLTGTLVANSITAQNGGARFFMTLDATGAYSPQRISLVQ